MKRKKKYSGTVLIADKHACDAAWALTKLSLLAEDVPPLPLKTCDRPAACKCWYKHFDDRRQSD